MRTNCHAHIFNFRAVFTPETLHILVNRLSKEKWPPFAQKAAEKVLSKALKGEYLDEDRLLVEFVKLIKADDALTDIVEELSTAEFQVVLEGDVANVPAKLLKKFIQRVSARLPQPDADIAKQDLRDLIEFLRIGLKPSIAAVADDLMRATGPDSRIVALTLDITKGGDADDEHYQAQLRDTAAAALAHPGRILPFVCVNPARTLHYERMTHALEELGYVGVKLYPSLGYSVDTAAMHKVYDYCVTHEVPVLLHCNGGGYYRDRAAIQFCNPMDWDPILRDRPDLKVCFGHFGGDENLASPLPPQGWTADILDLMRRHPGVYADISFHTAPLDGGASEANYFRNLKAILADSTLAPRILFGTDYHLVRQRVQDGNYWKFFRERFSAAEFKRLTESNPRAFLGLPDAAGRGAAANIVSHVRYLAKHNHHVRREPAAWVQATITNQLGQVKFHPNPFGGDWTRNNEAHFYTHDYFKKKHMSPTQRALKFTPAGHLTMKDLPRWPVPEMPADQREVAIRQIVTGLMAFVEQLPIPAAARETGKSAEAVRKALAAKIGDGSTRLADLGPVVDSCYRFKSEANT